MFENYTDSEKEASLLFWIMFHLAFIEKHDFDVIIKLVVGNIKM